MNRNELLKHIADTAYNIGVGAKKHFATHDIVGKMPGFIAFTSISIGVLSLVIDALTIKHVSAILVVLGIIGLYISFYDIKKDEYGNVGVKLTQLFNDLKNLYFDVKNAQDENLEAYREKIANIESQYYSVSISKQILFSDWYAHYKFFWQHQIDWIDEQKHFSLLRDKLPLTFSLFVLLLLMLAATFGFDLFSKACSYVL